MCGGILTSICIWSGHASASIFPTPFWFHNFLSIAPISFFILPYISFLLCFGAKTICTDTYICCGLCFLSHFLLSFIWKTSCFLVCGRQTTTFLQEVLLFSKSFRSHQARLVFCRSALFSSLGSTEGLFPRLKTTSKIDRSLTRSVDFWLGWLDLNYIQTFFTVNNAFIFVFIPWFLRIHIHCLILEIHG